jgi:predicted alpha/beta-fold hydrolase
MVQSGVSICHNETEEMSTGYNLIERIDAGKQAQPEAPPVSLEKIKQQMESRPFNPHPLFKSGHAQTLAAYRWPRRLRLMQAHRRDEARVFEVGGDVRLLAHCRWHKERLSHPTMLLVHGLEGSNTSVYMLSTANKAFRAGFNVVRLNLRTCGKTEHMAPTLYHGGLIGDLRAVMRELIEKDNCSRIFLVGFSMGGNMSLMLAGEDAERAPRELKGVCAVSPTIDLQSCQESIEMRENRLYMRSFIRSMRKRVRRKRKFFPERYSTKGLSRLRTIRDFDEHYTIVEGGYSSVEEYYERVSSIRVLDRIRTPTLMIHAQDDPFVPFHPFQQASIEGNPYLIFLAPEHGGHVGFLGADTNGEDRFWAENRTVEFFKLINEHLPS